MAFTVVEQYLEYTRPIRTAVPVGSGGQVLRAPGFEMVRQYWAYYVPEADIQTYVDKVQELSGADFVLEGEPSVEVMFDAKAGFFAISGTAVKRTPSRSNDDIRHSDTAFQFYGAEVLADDFDDNAIDAAKWDTPTNTDNAVSEASQKLKAISSGSGYGWLVTKTPGVLLGSRIDVKIVQHAASGRIQVSPTRSLVANDGLHGQNDFYEIEFAAAGQWRVLRRKSGGVVSARSGLFGPFTAPYSIRIEILGGEFRVYTKGAAATSWTEQFSETFDLGVASTAAFYVALGAEDTGTNGETHYDDFRWTR